MFKPPAPVQSISANIDTHARAKKWRLVTGVSMAVVLGSALMLAGCPQDGPRDSAVLNAVDMVIEGRDTFRHDTFGDEQFWGGTLRLHEAIAQLSPNEVLGLGLKVDAAALPRAVAEGILDGTLDLDDPALTQSLLEADAVVGVKGFFTKGGNLASIGITCAICHSTVDSTLTDKIGIRLDGWPNQDLNVGAIIAAAPDLSFFANLLGIGEQAVRDTLMQWGPGKFDAQLLLDGQSAPTLIPPAFGLAGVNLHTWTGWGGVSHWNAFVANIEMGGQGNFYDPRLNDPDKFPIAAANPDLFGNRRTDNDLITPKLAALQFYQLALAAPDPPAGSFNAAAAARGEVLFRGKADCARCHVPPLFTEPGWNMHTAEEIGIDDFQASRSPDEAYRTTPLKGLWTHTERGFFHDGRFETLQDVLDHYDATFTLGLTASEKADLEQYLLSL